MHWKGEKLYGWGTVQDLGDLDSYPALPTESLCSCGQITVTPCVLKVQKIFPKSGPLLEFSAIPATGYWKLSSPPDTWGWCARSDGSWNALLDGKVQRDFFYVTIRSEVCCVYWRRNASCENNCSLFSHPVGNTKLQLSRSHMEEPKLCGRD